MNKGAPGFPGAPPVLAREAQGLPGLRQVPCVLSEHSEELIGFLRRALLVEQNILPPCSLLSLLGPGRLFHTLPALHASVVIVELTESVERSPGGLACQFGTDGSAVEQSSQIIPPVGEAAVRPGSVLDFLDLPDTEVKQTIPSFLVHLHTGSGLVKVLDSHQHPDRLADCSAVLGYALIGDALCVLQVQALALGLLVGVGDRVGTDGAGGAPSGRGLQGSNVIVEEHEVGVHRVSLGYIKPGAVDLELHPTRCAPVEGASRGDLETEFINHFFRRLEHTELARILKDPIVRLDNTERVVSASRRHEAGDLGAARDHDRALTNRGGDPSLIEHIRENLGGLGIGFVQSINIDSRAVPWRPIGVSDRVGHLVVCNKGHALAPWGGAPVWNDPTVPNGSVKSTPFFQSLD